MFCTSLRRRPSFAPVIPALIASPALALQESDCETHDIALPCQTHISLNTTAKTLPRLHVLLLSPSSVTEKASASTIERIRRLSLLTGGQNIAIIFLLHPPANARFTSARLEHTRHVVGEDSSHNVKGTLEYAKLQTMLFDLQDLPHIPIYPVAKLDDLPALLASLRKAVGRGSLKTTSAPAATAFDLLQRCTASPPMALQTAYYLSDLFVDLADLAEACTNGGDIILDQLSPAQSKDERMVRLRDLVGNEEFQNLLDFWTDEWIAE